MQTVWVKKSNSKGIQGNARQLSVGLSSWKPGSGEDEIRRLADLRKEPIALVLKAQVIEAMLYDPCLSDSRLGSN